MSSASAAVDAAAPAKLLVVDDDGPSRDMLAQRLCRAGFDPITAANGPEALELLDRSGGAVDLMLLDVTMPGMSGLDVLKQLRLSYTAEQVPVIMVTARADSDAVVAALDHGANDYVTKPIDLPVALARIRTQLARRRAERALAESEERYALAVQGTNDGLWDWRIDTGEVYYSAHWKTLVGLEEGESAGTIAVWTDRIHPDDLDRVRQELDAHLQGETPRFESEHRLKHGTGVWRWVRVRAVAVRDLHAVPLRIAGSLTDITDSRVADALTGLPNRLLFMDRLARLIGQAKRAPTEQFAVLLLDIDRFKDVNDGLGHSSGDRFLVQLAERLEQTLRANDTVARFTEPLTHGERAGSTLARFGGDEFAVILSRVSGADAARLVAARVSQALAEPFVVGDHSVYATVSIGIALNQPDCNEPEEMLRDADTALHRAKASGRGGFAVFEEAMRVTTMTRLDLQSDMRQALDQGQFTVHYQPIVRLDTGTVWAGEALVRWNHPVRGVVSAGEFIAIAEESGFIIPLSLFVIREVCRQLRDWEHADPRLARLAIGVNIPGSLVQKTDLPERILEIAGEFGVGPERLELEIVENLVLAGPADPCRTIERLREAGFRLSIDDFGTGHSSLSHLHRLPVDRLKIDRSFTADCAQPSTCSIMRTVVTLAEHLGLEVVAEGVETAEQVAAVKRLGCGLGQGYFFARPLAPDAFARLVLQTVARVPATSGEDIDAANCRPAHTRRAANMIVTRR
jgi:PAS domain S-box-containing protein